MDIYQIWTTYNKQWSKYEVRAKKEAIYNEYNEVADKAMACLDFGFEDAMTVLVLPNGYRRFLRTSNHLERVNKELKRWSNVIGIFPNVDSLIRLMAYNSSTYVT